MPLNIQQKGVSLFQIAIEEYQKSASYRFFIIKTRSVLNRPVLGTFRNSKKNRYLVGEEPGNGDDGSFLNVSTVLRRSRHPGFKPILPSWVTIARRIVLRAPETLESKIGRIAGRVIKNPFVSVTIDGLMMRIPSYRASGSDREKLL